ncbi:MAG: N-6 DNA methylase [Phycisphaerales bacterium]|nr:N-6 DNA methylase [Phycisphaerales bacterium]MCI0629300.1 N-6 DNA methylase [Phycisphaerales bacterium]
MSAREETAWQGEFGISEKRSSSFIGSAIELAERIAPHGHVLRRAFALLELDGILCDQAAPLVYFKRVSQIRAQDVLELHRRFWNHGGAPILAVISPREVHIYSGFSRPTEQVDLTGLPSLVETIPRASAALREFLPSVESGEFFHRHATSFNPKNRVDRALLDNLQNTREELVELGKRRATPDSLDALLCRLVFTCYLFDRGVIGAAYLKGLGLRSLSHLRDVLGLDRRSDAKAALYKLFSQLAKDFNGDLFNDDLDEEAATISVAHLDVLAKFFHATDVRTGQPMFWPYDFSAIPIETISAIYERFLKPSDKDTGAFYTPRFLAELVLDLTLMERSSVLGLRCLDPACGSGIFLVGMFNRMAEEWRRANPTAGNDRRAKALMELLRSSVFGVDVNPTACRITAFSLYLAYLDQLTPRDIQQLQAKGRALPRLVNRSDHLDTSAPSGNIWCQDFFQEGASVPDNVDLVIGNPPWGSVAGEESVAAQWCDGHQREVPDRQIAAAFMWKGAEHVADNGRICLVLPHGILFNHSESAVSFQRSFLRRHAVDLALNLTDYQAFLFNEARHPAIVLKYRRPRPEKNHSIEYWAPKADWKVTKAEIITVSEHDRASLPLTEIMSDLEGEDAPQIWKRMSWASSRDRRLLDRLLALPRLRDRVRQPREKATHKPWLIAEGFQPFGENDSPSTKKRLELPARLFVPATSQHLRLILLPGDCKSIRQTIDTRRLIRDTRIFKAPHVLVAKGFGSIAYADFDVAFQHAVRGIHGPQADRKLLIFLAAYMRSALAQFFLFHTSSNWGVSRQEVHVEELLRLPFPLPETMAHKARAKEIIDEVARIVLSAARAVEKFLVDRVETVDAAQGQIEALIYEYFDLLPTERVLIEDTVRLTIPSFRPGSQRRSVPTIEPSTVQERSQYVDRLCTTLNGWSRSAQAQVNGTTFVSTAMGVGMVLLEKVARGRRMAEEESGVDVLVVLNQLREALQLKSNAFELARGVKVFKGHRLYVVKPLGRRHWTQSAALNDADEIAGSILMQSRGSKP